MSIGSHRILHVDDLSKNRDSWREVFSAEGYAVASAASLTQALTHLRNVTVDLVLSDVRLDRGVEGIELLRTVKAEWPSVPVILYTGWADPDDAASAKKLGAEDYISLPVSPLVMIDAVRAALEGVDHAAGCLPLERIVANSPAMKAALQWVHRIASTDTRVLITGETGTGKELIAHVLHARSKRALGPFVAVNCGAIPAGFPEAQFFGYRKGAFTSAVASSAHVSPATQSRRLAALV
jgi:DNA-binding NtrC family response regulator